jgi:GNAT superfamily N-acetyltransferase
VSGAPVLARREDGLEISTDPARLDLDLVHRWLSDESYWAAGRSREVVERSVAGSVCLGVYTGTQSGAEQVAFARVVTDDTTFAWVCDVFVAPQWRGRGVGSWMMRELVTELLERRGVLRLLLATRDAHSVYAQAGFAPLEGVWRWMELDWRPARQAILAMGPPDGTA